MQCLHSTCGKLSLDNYYFLLNRSRDLAHTALCWPIDTPYVCLFSEFSGAATGDVMGNFLTRVKDSHSNTKEVLAKSKIRMYHRN